MPIDLLNSLQPVPNGLKLNRVYGVVGPIGCGKTTVCEILKDHGCAILNADKIAHIVLQYESSQEPLIKIFGNEILDEDGLVNRKKVSKIIFSDEEKKLEFEKFMIPLVSEIIIEFASLATPASGVVIVEAFSILGTPLDEFINKVIFVDCELEIQLKRVMERNNLSEEEAMVRISAMPYFYTKHKIWRYVENNLTKEDLKFIVGTYIVPLL